MINKGAGLEQEVHAFIKDHLSLIGLPNDDCRVHLHKRYYSADRQADIVADVSIELFIPGAADPSIIWVWECKDYSGSVPVGAIQKFHADLQQLGSDRTKGTVITRTTYQKSAVRYARTHGIGLVRWLPPDKFVHIAYARGLSSEDIEIHGMLNEPQTFIEVLCDEAEPHITRVIRARRDFYGLTSRGFIELHGQLLMYMLVEIGYAHVDEVTKAFTHALGSAEGGLILAGLLKSTSAARNRGPLPLELL